MDDTIEEYIRKHETYIEIEKKTEDQHSFKHPKAPDNWDALF